MTESQQEKVTDADIVEILEQGEAGVADLMAAYEPIERDYFNAVQTSAPVITNSTNSTPR